MYGRGGRLSFMAVTGWGPQRQRTLTPGEITDLDDAYGLMVYRGSFAYARLAHCDSRPWATILSTVPELPLLSYE